MTIRIRLALTTCSLLLACVGAEATPPIGDDVGDGDTDDATDDASDTGDACQGPDGCFDCEPTDSIELTNACTDATCEPFANTPERLPLLQRDGELPPLP
jgi:hypothetical protein